MSSPNDNGDLLRVGDRDVEKSQRRHIVLLSGGAWSNNPLKQPPTSSYRVTRGWNRVLKLHRGLETMTNADSVAIKVIKGVRLMAKRDRERSESWS